jgi:hypothetical protein
MWHEICVTIITVVLVMDLFLNLAKYYKDYLEVEAEEEMTEEAKRMFN